MSKSILTKNRKGGGGFISDDDDDDEEEEGEGDSQSDEPESDELSVDSEAGPSSPRLKRLRRNPTTIGGSSKGKEPVTKSGRKTIGSNNKGKGKGKGKAWEGALEYTWDAIREDEDGGLAGAMSDAILGTRSKRTLRDTASIQRGIIRHVYLVLDLSAAMLVREHKDTWLALTIQYAKDFVNEFFDQNPISQMAILITREGIAERLTPLSGNPVEHIKALSNKKKLEARGEPSLQNVLDMARNGLAHLPPHGSREVIIILGSLTTCDPGNIHDTISKTAKDRIRVNIIGLSAEMKICKDICTATQGVYGVAKDDNYLRELLIEFVSPPATLSSSKSNVLGGPSNSNAPSTSSDLMMMGFPALVHSSYPGLCSCHSKLRNQGYTCPRCKSRICDVPTECRICGLTNVSSPHLARSYKHLFPVANYDKVNDLTLLPTSCYSCTFPFKIFLTPPPPINTTGGNELSTTGRYNCKDCKNHFCLDCDKLVHEALGFCPGCL